LFLPKVIIISILYFKFFGRNILVSHCRRRTAFSWAAGSGLSLLHLKVLSEHKSDSVVQSNIDDRGEEKRDMPGHEGSHRAYFSSSSAEGGDPEASS
jgi:hypothetical protein